MHVLTARNKDKDTAFFCRQFKQFSFLQSGHHFLQLGFPDLTDKMRVRTDRDPSNYSLLTRYEDNRPPNRRFD